MSAIVDRMRARAATKAIAERAITGTPDAAVLSIEIEELQRHADYVQSLERALLSLTPDGSEYYSRDGDGARVDVEACLAYIRRVRDDGFKARIEAARLRKQIATYLEPTP